MYGENRCASVCDRRMGKHWGRDGHEIDERIPAAETGQECQAASRMIVITAVLCTADGPSAM